MKKEQINNEKPLGRPRTRWKDNVKKIKDIRLGR